MFGVLFYLAFFLALTCCFVWHFVLFGVLYCLAFCIVWRFVLFGVLFYCRAAVDSDTSTSTGDGSESEVSSSGDRKPFVGKTSPFAEPHVLNPDCENITYEELYNHFRPRGALRLHRWAAVKGENYITCQLHVNYLCVCQLQVQVKSGRWYK